MNHMQSDQGLLGLLPQFDCLTPLSLLLDRDPQLIELFFVDAGRRIGHQILGGGGLSEGDDLADGFFTGEEHDDAVDAERDAAVRRRAVSERVEEEAEAAAKLFLAQAEPPEDALLNAPAVDSA